MFHTATEISRKHKTGTRSNTKKRKGEEKKTTRTTGRRGTPPRRATPTAKSHPNPTGEKIKGHRSQGRAAIHPNVKHKV